jgi:lactate dehydrogenase-like 2-hydroxyacid dehydrogenase
MAKVRDAAAAHGITVAEVTYSNSISVTEHVVMMILSLVRNYPPCHQTVLHSAAKSGSRCRVSLPSVVVAHSGSSPTSERTRSRIRRPSAADSTS